MCVLRSMPSFCLFMDLVSCRLTHLNKPTSDRIPINFCKCHWGICKHLHSFASCVRLFAHLFLFGKRGECNFVTCFAIIGEITEDSSITGSEEDKKIKGTSNTKFRLVGIVVHSGQASGGHYYSYVLQR